MSADNKLTHYRQRRDFDKSPEPHGKVVNDTGKKKGKNDPIFVIQKHSASHLHYDFRLEIGGVLKSWAVPKGPSTNPRIKRLAMPTDDHPLEYATFEGTIPEGSYGAGQVIVWDNGTFKNIKEKNGTIVPLKKCYENGRIEVFLDGKKLHGGYALIRTNYAENSTDPDKEKWLLIKMRDEYADARSNPVSSQPESVISGETIKDIKAKSKGNNNKSRDKNSGAIHKKRKKKSKKE